MGKDMNGYFTEEDIQIATKHMKTCLISLAVRKMQIKTTMRCYYTPFRMAEIKSGDKTKCWRG